MSEPTTARRVPRPSWHDPRLLLGVLLVLVSVVVGARVFAAADRYDRLYVAAHALVPGERLTRSDLSVGRARLPGLGADYLSAAADPPVGYIVRRYIGAGELVPAHALAPVAPGDPGRLVALPVAPGHLPPDLGPGSLVDVYLSAHGAGGALARPRLVAHDLAVQQRSGVEGAATLTVVVAVPADEVAAVVQAVESGVIDLVATPPAAVPTGAASPAAARR